MSKYGDLAKNLRARAYRLATKDFNGDGAKLGVEAADAIEELENIVRELHERIGGDEGFATDFPEEWGGRLTNMAKAVLGETK